VNQQRDYKDDSTIEDFSNENSTSSESVNQMKESSSSKKHSLTQKNTESHQNQDNDEISLCERKTHYETSQVNNSSNVSKSSCETSINSNIQVCDLCNKQC
jgi:hypothetical protein